MKAANATHQQPPYKGPDIRGIRKRRGWSQEQAAAAFGVSVRTLARWEAGTNPSRMAQRQIEAALEVERRQSQKSR